MTLMVVLVLLGADPDDKWLETAAATVVSVARENLADATRQLAAAKKARVNARAFGVNKKGETIYRDAEDKRKAIAHATTMAEAWKRALTGEVFGPLPVAEPPRDQPRSAGSIPLRGKVGDIGVLHGAAFVDQVISPTSALIAVEPERFEVGKYDAWLDIDTTGWVDEKAYRVNQPVVVLGTKQYESIGGTTRTVIHLRALTEPETTRLQELIKEEAKKYDTAPKR